jgi:hypothetical protein
MPFCQNESCNKTGLLRTEVEFDDELRKVLCRPCYTMRHPGVQTNMVLHEATDNSFAFGLYVTAREVDAEVRYAGVTVQARVPMTELKKLVAPHG